MADPFDQKDAREWVQRNAIPCPCCGAMVLVYSEGDEEVDRAFRVLRERSARFGLVSAEEAEADIRASGFSRPVDPIRSGG